MRIRARYAASTAGAILLACAGLPRQSTPEAGRALLDAYVRAWNTHDSLAFDTLLAPDGIHEDLAQGFRGRGPAQVRGFLRQVIAQEPDFRWRLTRVYSSDSIVAAEWTWASTYTGPGPSGPLVHQPDSGRGASIVVVRDGRIQRFTDYYDAASFFVTGPSNQKP